MPSSAAEPASSGPAPVELFVAARTLRGTLGEAFRRSCVELFERDHGANSGCFTAVARTVELTVVGVSAAGPVAVAAGIADPAFAGSTGTPPGRLVDVDALAGIGALSGPPGVDLRRWASIRMLGPGGEEQPDDLARLRIRVVTP